MGYSYYYFVYLADTENDRIVRLQYDWRYGWTIYAGDIIGGGLERPIDMDINTNFNWWQPLGNNDFLWVLNGTGEIKRFSTEGYLHSTYGTSGCTGAVGEFCRPTAIVCGRDAFLADPYDRYAHTDDIYVADPGNERIVRLKKDYAGKDITWMGEVPASPYIVDLEADNFGQIWAVDYLNNSITKYTNDLYPLCTFGAGGPDSTHIYNPVAIANAGGYLGLGNMFVSEDWTDSTGFKHFAIGTDIVNFTVTSSADKHWHHIQFVLIDPSFVSVKIKAIRDLPVKTIHEGATYTDYCSFVWDGTDNSGNPVSTDMYLISVVDSSSYVSLASNGPANIVTSSRWVWHERDAINQCIPGDAGGDGTINVSDAIYVTNYIFEGWPAPIPYRILSADAVCDCGVNVGDAVYIINYIFKGGPPPCNCSDWIDACGLPLRKENE